VKTVTGALALVVATAEIAEPTATRANASVRAYGLAFIAAA
jgi:hypothetical protein